LRDCYSCIKDEKCGWCGLEKKCIMGDRYGSIHKACLDYSFSICHDMFCSPSSTCEDCIFDEDCQWCSSTKSCMVIQKFNKEDCDSGDVIAGDSKLCKNIEDNSKLINNFIKDLNSSGKIDSNDLEEMSDPLFS